MANPGDVGDENVERLIGRYAPVTPDAAFVQRLEALARATGRDAGRARAAAQTTARSEARHARLRAWLRPAATAAAAALLVALGFALGRGDRADEPTHVLGSASFEPAPAFRGLTLHGDPAAPLRTPEPEPEPEPEPAPEAAPAPVADVVVSAEPDAIADLAFAAVSPGVLRAASRTPAAAPVTLAVGAALETGPLERQRVALPDGSTLCLDAGARVRVVAERRVALERGEVFVEVAPRPDDPFVLTTAGREVVALGTAFAVRADGPDPRVVVTHGRVRIGQDVLESGWRLSLRDLARTPLGRTTQVLDWARDLIASQDGPLVPRHAHAGGALLVSDPGGGEAPLALRRYAVDVHVEDGFARTAVDQTYFNHDLARHEGTFLFPLPPDASISRLAMYVEGTRMEGGMVERERARTVFEEILHQRRDPALLEWLDGSTFRMRVFPLEPRQEKRIVLGYTQRLASAYGAVTYRFPAGHSLGATGTWSFRVRVKGGARRAWECRTHALEAQKDGDDLLLVARAGEAALGRDVVLTIEPPATEAQVLSAAHDGARYLALRVRNDAELAPRPRRRDWVFVVETSADRDPLLARVAYDAVRGLLESAETGDTFALVAASTRATLLTDDREPCAPANVRAALERLEAQPLRGALDLSAALELAGEVGLDAEAPVIVHLGTAIPVLGERAEPALLAGLPERAQYVGIGVGKRWNRAFMRAAASRTGGYLTSIHPDEPVRWRALEVRSALDAPRLLDLQVKAPGSGLRFLTDADALAHGEDLLAVTRLEAHERAPTRLVVTGTLDGAPWRREVEVGALAGGALYLPRTWGRLELDRLLAAPEVDPKRIVALSKQLHVMSPYTSLLVLETEAMHRQYDVPMGRVEPWAPYELPALIPVMRESGAGANETRSVREVLESILVRRPADPLTLKPGAGGSTAWGEQTRREWAHLPRAMREDRILTADGNGQSRRRFLDQRDAELEEEESALRGGSFDEEEMSDRDLASEEESALLQAHQAPRPSPATAFGSNTFGGTTQRSLDRRATRDGSGDSLELARTVFGGDRAPAAVDTEATRPWRDRSAKVDLRDLRGRRVQEFMGVPPDHRRISADLLAFAPGMNTTQADVLTVLDAESSLGLHAAPGRIDPAAQALIEAARRAPWTTATVVNEAGEVATQVSFEGGGRFMLERLVTAGVRERIACDGTTLWHLYPELGVGARRTWSRFHHEDTLRGIVPWLLPATSDLARGADVVLASEGVVEVVPLGRDRDVEQLVFDGERLAERRWLDSRQQVTARERYGRDGVVEVEEQGELQRRLRFQLASRGAPERRELGPSSDLVVLPLPYRQVTPAEAANAAHELELAVGVGLCQPHASGLAIQKLDERLAGGDHRPGLLTLSLSLRLNDYFARSRGDPGPPRTEELPLERYVGGHLRWLSRSGGPLPPLDPAAPAGTLFARLSLFAHLHARWMGPRPWLETSADVRQVTRDGSLELLRSLARDPHGAELAMALGSMITWTEEDDPAELELVASVFEAIAERPWLAEPAGLEAARLRLALGEVDLARTRLLALHGRALAEGRLLPIDAALHRALGPAFADWAREAAEVLVAHRAPLSALKLAGACDALGDVALCRELAVFAAGDAASADPRTVELASRVLCEAGAADRALELLTAALAGPRADAELAWYAMHVADSAARRPLALAWLELVIELDDASPLDVLRPRFEGLFARYEQTLEALRTLDQPPPPELVLRIVRAIDRWRALDPDLTQPCQRASRLLAQLGEDPLAWDYLVTPLALKPADAATWASTAIALRRSGSLELADQAWAQAFACEQTNASYLWSRAELLLSRGEAERARPVLERLAAGSWHARFASFERQARAALSTVARGEVRRAAARHGLDAMDAMEAEAVRPAPARAAAAEPSAR